MHYLIIVFVGKSMHQSTMVFPQKDDRVDRTFQVVLLSALIIMVNITFIEIDNFSIRFFSWIYAGIGSDPNYGSFISQPNIAGGGGIVPISYNPDSNLFGSLINPTYQHQQQQQPNYLYNNYNSNNNAWQRPNSNNYNNQFANRYPPGSQGWYATGGNYWYNNGQSIIVHPYLLIITIAFLVFCK